jgi:hypothetical protein
MYKIDEKDRVVPIDTIPHALTGTAFPTVVADEHITILRYCLIDKEDQQEKFAILHFEHCWAHYMGPPNCEALHGHPLYERGLSYYGIFEVLDSSWIRLMEERNRVHDKHSPARYAELRHFIFSFEDTTFECIAKGVVVQIMPYEEGAAVFARMVNRIPVTLFEVKL